MSKAPSVKNVQPLEVDEIIRDLVFFGMWLQSRLIQVNDLAMKLFILKSDNNFILIQVYLGALWCVPSGPSDYGWKLEIIILQW